MYKRDYFLDRLELWKDSEELIKVVSGVRRCGKSSLLALYAERLVELGVKPQSIVQINLEDMEYRGIDSADKLNDFIISKKAKRGKTYILLDEVQQINEWERALNSLRLDRNLDIYITGSNTHLLNSRLASLLSGRYVELRMFPLSFKEYLVFSKARKTDDKPALFRQYLLQGGFPGIFALKDRNAQWRDYLSGIYNTIVMKDVVRMNRVRDVDIMEKIIRFLADNSGRMVSAKKIADYFTSSGRKTTSDTVDSYISMLEDAYLFYRAKRNDLNGKGILKTNDKFYIVDPGLRNFLAGSQSNYGSALETLVYFELLRRGYDVTIGKIDSLEVDFVARRTDSSVKDGRPGEIIYVQVSASLSDPQTREREIVPLQKIKENYRKLILSMDETGPFTDIAGMEHRNIIDFLLE